MKALIHFATRQHAAICGKLGHEYTSSPIARVVTCPKCLAKMKENLQANLGSAGLL